MYLPPGTTQDRTDPFNLPVNHPYVNYFPQGVVMPVPGAQYPPHNYPSESINPVLPKLQEPPLSLQAALKPPTPPPASTSAPPKGPTNKPAANSRPNSRPRSRLGYNKKSSVVDFKTLAENLLEEDRIAGNHWIGRRLECYLSHPLGLRGYYPGVITNYHRDDKDTEYLVHYDNSDRVEWVVIEVGMHFLDKQFQPEMQQVIELRQSRSKFKDRWEKKDSNDGHFADREKHTMVGSEYQIDLEAALKYDNAIRHDDLRIGESLWSPDRIKCPEAVEAFFRETAAPQDDEDMSRGREISFLEDHSTTPLEEAFHTLHNHNYDAVAATKEMKGEGRFWCLQKPGLSTHWRSVEVVTFELAMKTDPKNFREIQRKIGTKTLQEVIHFYWYWKTTVHYKEWKKKDRFSLEGAVNFRMDYAIALKEESSPRNPRLRSRPRVDYAYPTTPLVRSGDRLEPLFYEEKKTPAKTKTPLRNSVNNTESLSKQDTRAPVTYQISEAIQKTYAGRPVLDIIILATISEEHLEEANKLIPKPVAPARLLDWNESLSDGDSSSDGYSDSYENVKTYKRADRSSIKVRDDFLEESHLSSRLRGSKRTLASDEDDEEESSGDNDEDPDPMLTSVRGRGRGRPRGSGRGRGRGGRGRGRGRGYSWTRGSDTEESSSESDSLRDTFVDPDEVSTSESAGMMMTLDDDASLEEDTSTEPTDSEDDQQTFENREFSPYTFPVNPTRLKRKRTQSTTPTFRNIQFQSQPLKRSSSNLKKLRFGTSTDMIEFNDDDFVSLEVQVTERTPESDPIAEATPKSPAIKDKLKDIKKPKQEDHRDSPKRRDLSSSSSSSSTSPSPEPMRKKIKTAHPVAPEKNKLRGSGRGMDMSSLDKLGTLVKQSKPEPFPDVSMKKENPPPNPKPPPGPPHPNNKHEKHDKPERPYPPTPHSYQDRHPPRPRNDDRPHYEDRHYPHGPRPHHFEDRYNPPEDRRFPPPPAYHEGKFQPHHPHDLRFSHHHDERPPVGPHHGDDRGGHHDNRYPSHMDHPPMDNRRPPDPRSHHDRYPHPHEERYNPHVPEDRYSPEERYEPHHPTYEDRYPPPPEDRYGQHPPARGDRSYPQHPPIQHSRSPQYPNYQHQPYMHPPYPQPFHPHAHHHSPPSHHNSSHPPAPPVPPAPPGRVGMHANGPPHGYPMGMPPNYPPHPPMNHHNMPPHHGSPPFPPQHGYTPNHHSGPPPYQQRGKPPYQAHWNNRQHPS